MLEPIFKHLKVKKKITIIERSCMHGKINFKNFINMNFKRSEKNKKRTTSMLLQRKYIQKKLTTERLFSDW